MKKRAERRWPSMAVTLPPELLAEVKGYADDHYAPLIDVVCNALAAYIAKPRVAVPTWPRWYGRARAKRIPGRKRGGA